MSTYFIKLGSLTLIFFQREYVESNLFHNSVFICRPIISCVHSSRFGAVHFEIPSCCLVLKFCLSCMLLFFFPVQKHSVILHLL